MGILRRNLSQQEIGGKISFAEELQGASQSHQMYFMWYGHKKTVKTTFPYPNLGLWVIRKTFRGQDKTVQLICLFKENISKMAENNDVWEKIRRLRATCHFVVFIFISKH